MAKEAIEKKRKGSVKRTLITTGLIFAILYVGIHVVSRTEGFRSLVTDKISSGTAQPVSLEKCGATPLLGLRLQGLSFQGVTIPEAKASFNFNPFTLFSKKRPVVSQLYIRELEVQFKRIPKSGKWEPLVLHGIGSRFGAVVGLNPPSSAADENLPTFPPYVINEQTLLQLDRAKVVWRDEKGAELAYLTDVDSSLRSRSFMNRRVIQTIIKCGHIKLARGAVLRDFRLEAFRVEGSGMVTVLDMTDSQGEYDEFASATLWQDLNLYLNRLSGN